MTLLRAVSLVLAGIVPSLLGTSVGASAQNYPNQVVRIVVPFSAGSITDGLARILADKLGELWKQQVIVENRPGLPGTTGVAKGAMLVHRNIVANLLQSRAWLRPFLGSEREIKAAGLMRQEPKDYVIQDGDIINIKHST